MKTPNIDALAKEGVLFTMAYSQTASCYPTRQSFLTGLRSYKTGYDKFFRNVHPNIITLPEYFKKNGYHTASLGKVFHVDDTLSWSEPSWRPAPFLFYPEYRQKENVLIQLKEAKKGLENTTRCDLFWMEPSLNYIKASAFEINDLPDFSIYDGRTTGYAKLKLHNLKDKKFFLAVGFSRPHLPFIAPKKYFDMYPLEEIKPPENNTLPKGSPSFSVNCGINELLGYSGIDKNIFSNKEKQKEIIRGYYASVSYVDALIGNLLRELKNLDLGKNTIVILVGDQGMHTFENGTFGKNTNFDVANRSALIIKYPPKVKQNAIANTFVELIDIFPTLCDLASLPVPKDLDGKSFSSILKNPSLNHKSAAYSELHCGNFPGWTVRTGSYRYTEWVNKKTKETFKELYDLSDSPVETINIAGDLKYKDIVDNHAKLLREIFEVSASASADVTTHK